MFFNVKTAIIRWRLDVIAPPPPPPPYYSKLPLAYLSYIVRSSRYTQARAHPGGHRAMTLRFYREGIFAINKSIVLIKNAKNCMFSC